MKKKEYVWEAWTGVQCINLGRRRNGKPHNTLAVHVVTVFSQTDADAWTKKDPMLKFHKRERRDVHVDAKASARTKGDTGK